MHSKPQRNGKRENAAWRKRIIFPFFVSWYLCAAGFRFHKAYTFEIAQTRAWHEEPLTFYEQLPALVTFSAFCVEDALFIGALAVLCLAVEQLTRCRALLISISYVLSLVCILFGCAEHAYFMATGTLLSFDMIDNALTQFGGTFTVEMALTEFETARYLLVYHVGAFFVLLVIQNLVTSWLGLRIAHLVLNKPSLPSDPPGKATTTDQSAKSSRMRLYYLLILLFVMIVGLVAVGFSLPDSMDESEASRIKGSVPLRALLSASLLISKKWSNQPAEQEIIDYLKPDDEDGLGVPRAQQKEESDGEEGEEDEEDLPDAPYHAFVKPVIANNTNTLKRPTKNVVVIVLESTRPDFCTPYYESTHKRFFSPPLQLNPHLKVTPFLDVLNKHVTRGNRAFPVSAYTVKSLVGTFCGTYAAPSKAADIEAKGVYATCMPNFLKEYDYQTGFFMSAGRDFDSMALLMPHMIGFEDFYDTYRLYDEFAQNMSRFSRVGYMGEEDMALVYPIMSYVDEAVARHRPFMVFAPPHIFEIGYLTVTTHHPFDLPPQFPLQEFVAIEKQNKHINTLRYVDAVLERLYQEFENRKLIDDTLFVILGDHGIGFFEHQISGVVSNPYDEAFRIPFFMYGGGLPDSPKQIDGLISSLDVFPTVLDFLFDHKNVLLPRQYEGLSLLQPIPKDRCVFTMCSPAPKCLVVHCWPLKLVRMSAGEADKLFNLETDPEERVPLVPGMPDYPEERAAEMLKMLRRWKRRVQEEYSKALDHNRRYQKKMYQTTGLDAEMEEEDVYY